MSHPISLSFLTVFDVDALSAIRIAAATGYDAVGLRLLPAAATGEADYPLLRDDDLLREARLLLQDTGMAVADIEIARLKPDTRVSDFERLLERGAALGARHLLVAGDDPEHGRLTGSFAALCALAKPYGLTCDLEFMPWTGVRDLAAARDIVRGAQAENGGVLIDALHFDRSKSRVEDIATVPAGRINYVQICDGHAEYDASDAGLIEVARNARLFAGEGDIDLGGILKAVPDGVMVSVEVPKRAIATTVGAAERARQGLETTERLLASIGRSRGGRGMESR